MARRTTEAAKAGKLVSRRRIARKLGVSEATVRRDEERAIAKMREAAAEQELKSLSLASLLQMRIAELMYLAELMQEGFGDEGPEPPPWM